MINECSPLLQRFVKYKPGLLQLTKTLAGWFYHVELFPCKFLLFSLASLFILTLILTESQFLLLFFPAPPPSPSGSLGLLPGLPSTKGLVMWFYSKLKEVYSITIYYLRQIQQLQVCAERCFVHSCITNTHTYLQANSRLAMHTPSMSLLTIRLKNSAAWSFQQFAEHVGNYRKLHSVWYTSPKWGCQSICKASSILVRFQTKLISVHTSVLALNQFLLPSILTRLKIMWPLMYTALLDCLHSILHL